MSVSLPLSFLWKDVLQAVSDSNNPKPFYTVFMKRVGGEKPAVRPAKRKVNCRATAAPLPPIVLYHLGTTFAEKYLTPREGDCMALMMHHYKNSEIAKTLALSPRTVEFYIKNMRQKLNCHSRLHLIETIRKTDFMQHLDTIFAKLLNSVV